MKNNKLLKSIFGSGALALGSLSVFAGCGSESGDQFSAIKTELNNLFNNGVTGAKDTDKGGKISVDNTLFNIEKADQDAFTSLTDNWTTKINADKSKVNLSVKQVIDYAVTDGAMINAEVLVHDSAINTAPKVMNDKNFANNFITAISYQVDKKDNVTKLLTDDGTINFENQSMGNSITTVNGTGGPNKINPDYTFTFNETGYFDPTQEVSQKNNALFLDNRTNGDYKSKTKPYSLPNALMNAAMGKNSGGVQYVNSNDYKNVKTDFDWSSASLNLKIGYTENLKVVTNSVSNTTLFGLKADKMSFSDLTILIKDTTQDYRFAFISDLPILNKHSDTFNFFATNVGFSFASDGTNYVGYFVGGFEVVKNK